MLRRDAPDPGAPPVGNEPAKVVSNADDRGPRDHLGGEAPTRAERTGAMPGGRPLQQLVRQL
jgi:hypothetical protein